MGQVGCEGARFNWRASSGNLCGHNCSIWLGGDLREGQIVTAITISIWVALDLLPRKTQTLTPVSIPTSPIKWIAWGLGWLGWACALLHLDLARGPTLKLVTHSVQ